MSDPTQNKSDDPLLSDMIGDRISYWGGTFTIRDLQADMPMVPPRRIHSRIRTLVMKRAVETVAYVRQGDERVAVYRVVPRNSAFLRLPRSFSDSAWAISGTAHDLLPRPDVVPVRLPQFLLP